MTVHRCSIHPCPICAIQSRQDFPADSPWRGDARELTEIVEHLKVLRSQWGLDVKAAQPASPTRDRKRTSLLGAVVRDETLVAVHTSDGERLFSY